MAKQELQEMMTLFADGSAWLPVAANVSATPSDGFKKGNSLNPRFLSAIA